MSRRLDVVLATRNAGKVREFERLLGEGFGVRPLPDDMEMPEETGATFSENALLKARTVFVALDGRTAVLADDSGLEVDSLGGAPGVESARYAGGSTTDEENVAKLLRELGDSADRGARFVCSLCLVVPGTVVGDETVLEARGEMTGVIEAAPRGAGGFGYDPVFRPTGWTETLAEVTPEKKNEVSHRGAAARSLALVVREAGLGSGVDA